MSMNIGGITIDCADPTALADFWTKALDTTISQDYGGEFVALATPEGQPYVAFQKVPEERVGKNRVHIDFATDDLAGEVERLVGLGATALAEHAMPDFTWRVMEDPAGNVFCVCAAHE
jgi:predicted enzyme related to lactoylglutathione lyase